MGLRFFLLAIVVFCQSVNAAEHRNHNSDSFIKLLDSKIEISKLLGFPSPSDVVVHLGYGTTEYENKDALKKILKSDIRSRPADTLHVFYLTGKGLSAVLKEVMLSKDLLDHGRILTVIPSQFKNHTLNDVADLYVRNKSVYRQINLSGGHQWEDFVYEFMTKISRQSLDDHFKAEILMKEGGDAELKTILNLVTHSRFLKGLGPIDVELGMGYLPKRESNVYQLAATHLKALADPINEINRYLSFTPTVLISKKNFQKTLLSKVPFPKFTNVSVSSDRGLVDEQVSDFLNGTAHRANSFSRELNELSAKVFFRLNKYTITIGLIGGRGLYEDLIEKELKVSVLVSGSDPDRPKVLIFDPEDWTSISASKNGSSVVEAEKNLNESMLSFLPNPGVELVMHREDYSPRMGNMPFSVGIEDFDLLSVVGEQKNLISKGLFELKKSEIIAINDQIVALEENFDDIESTLKPRNQKFTSTLSHYPDSTNALIEYRSYLSYLRSQLSGEKAKTALNHSGCAPIFIK